jgi:iron complex outermembrane recepter protein
VLVSYLEEILIFKRELKICKIMKKQKILSLLFFLVISSICKVQSQSTSLKFINAQKKAAIGVTVKIQDRSDTTKILFRLTDTLGIAQFNSSTSEQYLISATSVGFKPLQRIIKIKSREFVFEMTENNSFLKEVVVTTKKPLMKQEDDVTIVDAQQLAPSSINGYEVIEKTPGLYIDTEGNVYLSSSTPATIYINGREQKMSASDVASMLKNLPSNSIERIEIMRTPSAKYDASTAGGAVNIVLKKGAKIGLMGSVNVGANQGKYGDQYIGFNISNNVENKTAYLNMNYTKSNKFESIVANRKISETLNLSQDSYTIYPANSLYSGFGFGNTIGSKWEYNYDANITYNPNKSVLQSVNRQYFESKTFSELNNITNNNVTGFLTNHSISTKYKIDTLGSEIVSNFSYNYFSKSTGQDFNTTIVDNQKTNTYKADFSSVRHLYIGQIDLTYKFSNKVKLETGLKSSIQNFNSLANFSNTNGINLPKNLVDNNYKYQENINATYLMFSKSMNKFIVKAGFRVENTNMDGQAILPKDTSFVINRTDLFPYLHLSKSIVKIAGYQLKAFLIARRSITRPSYDYLNPTVQAVSQFLYQVGNPSLRPQFTQTYEANISVDDLPIFAIGRNFTNDVFTNVVFQDSKNPSISYNTYDNLGKNTETYFRLLGGIPPGSRYFFAFGLQYSLNHYEGIYEKKPLDFERGSWRIFTFQRFKIDDLTNISLNGFLMLNGQQQFYLLENFGNLNINLNRYFFNRNVMASLYMNDVFFTNRNSFTLNQGSIATAGTRYSDSQRIGLSIRYNFGKKKKQEKVNMFDIENMSSNK